MGRSGWASSPFSTDIEEPGYFLTRKDDFLYLSRVNPMGILKTN